MNRGFVLSLAASVCAGAAGFYVGSVSTAPVLPSSSIPQPTAPSTPSPAESPALRAAVVDVKRLFTAHPDTKPSQDAINTQRDAVKSEFQRLKDSGDTDAANRFRESREKEIQADSAQRRKLIDTDLQQRITTVANNRNFTLVFDISGTSLNGVPTVMHANLPDLTNDVVHELSR